MERGINGEMRKGGPIRRAMQSMGTATALEDEQLPGKRRNAGLERAATLSPEHQPDLSCKEAQARWGKPEA